MPYKSLRGLDCPKCGEKDIGFVPPCWLVCSKCGVLHSDKYGISIWPENIRKEK